MRFKVVKVCNEGGRQFFQVSSGMKLFGVWLTDGAEPLVQKIVVPFDESASNRYLNVKDRSIRAAVLKAVDEFKRERDETH